ncbi:hypothetical protein ATK30_6839 [Amycolatopsis echigonensis]|uniref:Uncharacterized protein n=1 Tax=Amycolatopsis echigonensis TaxID=2576905 RepID=A0A2N3WPU5_9PSEU|nr:hypothetical protein [Amycolatopsis niigatensis]PKV95906.1 hypothetical protein ATK30_6839 [Amycolatopsis niigatensis]
MQESMPGRVTNGREHYDQPTTRKELEQRLVNARQDEAAAREQAERSIDPAASEAHAKYVAKLIDELELVQAQRKADPPKSRAWHDANRLLGG